MTEKPPAETADTEVEAQPNRPEWGDEYLDRVADRLQSHYDLERGYAVGSEQFDMYGRLHVESQKQFLHRSLNWANYESFEHLFVQRDGGVSCADLDTLVQFGHDLADDWIEADEEHHGTEFTFVLVVPRIPRDVREQVDGFRERTLLRYGYHGRYEINLIVVAPDEEDAVASEVADAVAAFELWRDPSDRTTSGLLGRLRRWLR